MKNRVSIFLVLLIGSELAWSNCTDLDKGIEPMLKSVVYFSTQKKNCVNEKDCVQISLVNKDVCVNDKILMEQYCDNNEPESVKVDCSKTRQSCKNGKCQ